MLAYRLFGFSRHSEPFDSEFPRQEIFLMIQRRADSTVTAFLSYRRAPRIQMEFTITVPKILSRHRNHKDHNDEQLKFTINK